eukprot:UN16695
MLHGMRRFLHGSRDNKNGVIKLRTLTAFLNVSVSGQNANHFRLSTISMAMRSLTLFLSA